MTEATDDAAQRGGPETAELAQALVEERIGRLEEELDCLKAIAEDMVRRVGVMEGRL